MPRRNADEGKLHLIVLASARSAPPAAARSIHSRLYARTRSSWPTAHRRTLGARLSPATRPSFRSPSSRNSCRRRLANLLRNTGRAESLPPPPPPSRQPRNPSAEQPAAFLPRLISPAQVQAPRMLR